MLNTKPLPNAPAQSEGLSEGLIADLLRSLESVEGPALDPHAIAIARNGKVLFEGAWEPYRVDTAALVYSVSKTFTSLAIGFCVEEGLITVEDDAGEILGVPNPSKILVKHLLSMNTGHESPTIESWSFKNEDLFGTEPEHAAGSHFAYNNNATFALGSIVTKVTGCDITEYLRPRLLDPLGIGTRWMARIGNQEQGFSGFHLEIGDLLKTGIMLADDGEFEGTQVAPKTYVQDMQKQWSITASEDATPRDDAFPDITEDDWSYGYGYQVWLGRKGFRLDGAYGQFSIVLPDEKIVVAYQGATPQTPRTLNKLWQFINKWVDSSESVSSSEGADIPVGVVGSEDSVSASVDHNLSDLQFGDLDSWSVREAFELVPPLNQGNEPVEGSTGWKFVESNGSIALQILDEEHGVCETVPVGIGQWARTVVPVNNSFGEELVVPIAVRADVDERGGVTAHVVLTSTPHRMIVRGQIGGPVEARWCTVPLWKPSLGANAVPRFVSESTRETVANKIF